MHDSVRSRGSTARRVTRPRQGLKGPFRRAPERPQNHIVIYSRAGAEFRPSASNLGAFCALHKRADSGPFQGGVGRRADMLLRDTEFGCRASPPVPFRRTCADALSRLRSEPVCCRSSNTSSPPTGCWSSSSAPCSRARRSPSWRASSPIRGSSTAGWRSPRPFSARSPATRCSS